MGRPNYQYEKRARELAKKQKKEEKLKRRQERGAQDQADPDVPGTEENSPTDPATETPPGHPEAS